MTIRRAQETLEIKRGDTFKKRFILSNSLDQFDMDARISLTGYTIEGTARANANEDVWFELPITVIDAAKGEFGIYMDDVATRAITGTGMYQGGYDIQVTDPNGKDWTGTTKEEVFTFMYGTIVVDPDYTTK